MLNTGPEEYLHVVVGVIENNDASLLLARRPSHLHQGGKWEFPGGKIEPGELPIDALQRELNEELGIKVSRATPLIQVPFRYDEYSVLLDVWQVHDYSGDVFGREGQDIRWLPKDKLGFVEFPAANHAIIAALSFPHVYAISAVARYGEDQFYRVLDTALKNGLEMLQLREPGLDKKQFSRLAAKVVERCHQNGARVLLNCNPSWIAGTAADGIHLTQRRLMSARHRPLGEEYLVAASCHDELSLQKAAEIAANFVVLSPVKKTVSHPGARPIGWQRFKELSATTGLPVYALGGMALSEIGHARQFGAQGVALISGIWQTADEALAIHF